MATLAEKFSGFAHNALDKLAHPIESVKHAWEHELDRIIYWGTVGDNMQARSMVLKYLSGVSKSASATYVGAGVVGMGTAFFSPYLIGVPLTMVGIQLNRYFTGTVAEHILDSRSRLQVTGSSKKHEHAIVACESDADKVNWMESHLSRAAQFNEVMDSAMKFGVTQKIFPMANQQNPRNSSFIARHIDSDTGIDRLSVAIRNIQKKGSESLNSLDRAAECVASMTDAKERDAGYCRIAEYAAKMADASMIIPSPKDLKRPLGMDFMERVEQYKAMSENLAGAVAMDQPQTPTIVEQIQNAARATSVFNASRPVREAVQYAVLCGSSAQKSIMKKMASDHQFAQQYADVQAHVIRTTLKAQNAIDIGLVEKGSDTETKMVDNLRSIHRESKIWPMSSVAVMVENLLNKIVKPSSPHPDVDTANQPRVTASQPRMYAS